MNPLFIKIRTALALGLTNLARVCLYRLGLRTGLHPVLRLKVTIPGGSFFSQPDLMPIQAPASMRWLESGCYFGWKETPLFDGRPEWFRNPFQANVALRPDVPWWDIPDFDPSIGDIKTIWEASRFDWVVAYAQRGRNGARSAIQTLNFWLNDWVANNPPYRGPNWKCGQEASIRLMNLATAALILDQTEKTLPSLTALLNALLQRIEPTIGYAIGQNNNHGTSEAAALFIGGHWLSFTRNDPSAQILHHRGRELLEEQASRLIAPDGTFSQYSVIYQRLMLDTFSIVEAWRRRHALPPFSPRIQARLAAASRWLRELVDVRTGDAPNLGANDGTRLLSLTDTDYRDFRPSVQLASVLFENHRAYSSEGAWDAPLVWLGINMPPASEAECSTSRLLDQGGLALLRDNRTLVLIRYPRFRFRPSHADALHVDLWRDGENLLRDSGTYSYADTDWNSYFSGTRSHNTIEFDGRDQMPRIGRFLFGDWLKGDLVVPPTREHGTQRFAVAYRDRSGVHHERSITLSQTGLTIKDTIFGFRQKAVLRWRLKPGTWRLSAGGATNGAEALTVETTMPVSRMEIVTGYESRYYLSMSEIPVLEVEVTKPGVIISQYRF